MQWHASFYLHVSVIPTAVSWISLLHHVKLYITQNIIYCSDFH
uniref:Uncharacterized protein n=1 Tax=Anguilla anguilla TaxID=7936 RepID=A0A0E9PFS5_ANGAN